jgi:UDP-2,3-diacylglucosamine pyrophosphatase LpxH
MVHPDQESSTERTHHLFVISDLHLGGRPPVGDDPGFQLCPPNSRRRLARLINFWSDRGGPIPPEDSIEIVINGDFIDFLVEEPFLEFSSADALEKLQSVVRSCDEGAPDQERVFPALRRFLGLGNKLTILLGNHDIELSLPMVRCELFRVLSEDRPVKLEFVFDGEAYVVGDVLIEHGNRYDGWNAVRYGELRAFRSSLSRGESLWPFEPPAGSRLVASVLNPLKSRYRFIDLLKPENEALLPVLCSLEPALALQLSKVVPLWFAKRAATGEVGRVKEAETFIAKHQDAGGRVPKAVARAAAHGTSGTTPASSPEDAAEEVSRDERTRRTTAQVLAECIAASRESQHERPDGRVGLMEMEVANVWDGGWLTSPRSLWRGRKDRPAFRYRQLARAFARHRELLATTFEIHSLDPPYHTAAKRLTSWTQTRIVVFGHTHVPKAIPLGANGCYLNTGTWCPTVRLKPCFYSGDAEDESVVNNIATFVDDLANNRLKPWSELQTVFAHIQLRRGVASTAMLCESHEDGSVTPIYGAA